MHIDKAVDLYRDVLALEAIEDFDSADAKFSMLIATRASSFAGIAGKVHLLAKAYCPSDGDMIGKLILSLNADLDAHVPI